MGPVCRYQPALFRPGHGGNWWCFSRDCNPARRMKEILISTMFAGIALSRLLGGDAEGGIAESTGESETTCSISVATYLSQHGRDYANPTFSLDHDMLHFEARYNYEAIKTGSF